MRGDGVKFVEASRREGENDRICRAGEREESSVVEQRERSGERGCLSRTSEGRDWNRKKNDTDGDDHGG